MTSTNDAAIGGPRQADGATLDERVQSEGHGEPRVVASTSNEAVRDASDLTISQAARELKVFPEQIESWVESGTFLNVYALPGMEGLRIPRAGVEALKRNGHTGLSWQGS